MTSGPVGYEPLGYAAPGGGHPAGHPVGRRGSRASSALRAFVAFVLCVLTGVLAVGGVLGVWARGQVLDTGRYLETVAPIVASTTVQDDLARTVARAISDQIDVDALVTALGEGIATLPPGTVLPGGVRVPDGVRLTPAAARTLAPELQAALETAIEDVARDFTRSQAFGELWVSVNRAGHTKLVRLLDGDGRPVPGAVVEAGRLRLDLTPAVEAVRARLEDAGLAIVGRIPPVRLVVDVADVSTVERARPVVAGLDRLGRWAPYLVGACALLALVAARRRLPMLGWLAVSVGVGMLVVWLALRYLRSVATGELEASGVTPGVAVVVVDQLTSLLRDGIRVVAGGAVAVGVIALAGTAVGSLRALRGPRGDGGAPADVR